MLHAICCAAMGCVGLWIVGRGMSTRASGSMARPTTHLVDVAANQQKWGDHRDIITNSGIFGCPAIPLGGFGLAPFFIHSGLQFSDKPQQQQISSPALCLCPQLKIYPLVNIQKTMERSTMLLMGKSSISMAILNSFLYVYQRILRFSHGFS